MINATFISSDHVPESPSFGDEVTEFLPWVAAIVVLAPITLLSLVLWAPFLLVLALVAAPVLAVCAVGAVIALLAVPFVLVHRRHRKAATRERSPQRVLVLPRLSEAEPS